MPGLLEHDQRTTPEAAHPRTLFARGFLAMLPLWVGAIPIGIAYAVAARGAGLTPGATQLMSLTVFSAAAQVSAVSLIAAGVPALLPIVTGMALNAQLLLLGLAAGRQTRPNWWARLGAAWFLTDGAFAIAAARGRLRLPLLVGAGVSMYLGWNAGTAVGLLAGRVLPDPSRLGVDVIVPVTFLAVLVPLLRTRAAVLTALVAAAATLLLREVAPGVAILGAGLAGSIAGAWWSRRGPATPAEETDAP